MLPNRGIYFDPRTITYLSQSANSPVQQSPGPPVSASEHPYTSQPELVPSHLREPAYEALPPSLLFPSHALFPNSPTGTTNGPSRQPMPSAGPPPHYPSASTASTAISHASPFRTESGESGKGQPALASASVSLKERAPAKKGKERMKELRARQNVGEASNSAQYEKDQARPNAEGQMLTAHDLILQWLQQPDNYRSFGGKSIAVKTNVAGNVRVMLEERGCRRGRTDTAIAGKIRAIIDEAKRGADECAKAGFAKDLAGHQDVDKKTKAMFPESWALRQVMEETGTDRPIHLHQSTSLENDGAANAHAIMFGNHVAPRDNQAGGQDTDTRDKEIRSSGGGNSPSLPGQSTGQSENHTSSDSHKAVYSTALADPGCGPPGEAGPPQGFENKREEELYRRRLAHRARDAIDASLLVSSDEADSEQPRKKRQRPPSKKQAKAKQAIADEITKSDNAIFQQVEDLRKGALKAAGTRLKYEQDRDKA